MLLKIKRIVYLQLQEFCIRNKSLKQLIVYCRCITLANKKSLFLFKVRLKFLLILERNDVLNPMLPSGFP